MPTGHAPSKAHSIYPYGCCGNFDCGVIVQNVHLPNGNKVITIKIEADGREFLQSTVFPKDFQTLPALDDEKEHACISRTGKPLCLFLQGGF